MELARAAGTTWQVIDEIAKGRRVPRADLARRISAATGGVVSAAVLMGLTDGDEASPVNAGRPSSEDAA